MKIFNSVYKNNIAFERNLAARASVLSENGDAHSVKIYHLNKEDDVNCLKNVINNANWQNNFYLEEAAICFPDDYESEKYYVMEDESGELLCYGILNLIYRNKEALRIHLPLHNIFHSRNHPENKLPPLPNKNYFASWHCLLHFLNNLHHPPYLDDIFSHCAHPHFQTEPMLWRQDFFQKQYYFYKPN